MCFKILAAYRGVQNAAECARMHPECALDAPVVPAKSAGLHPECLVSAVFYVSGKESAPKAT